MQSIERGNGCYANGPLNLPTDVFTVPTENSPSKIAFAFVTTVCDPPRAFRRFIPHEFRDDFRDDSRDQQVVDDKYSRRRTAKPERQVEDRKVGHCTQVAYGAVRVIVGSVRSGPCRMRRSVAPVARERVSFHGLDFSRALVTGSVFANTRAVSSARKFTASYSPRSFSLSTIPHH